MSRTLILACVLSLAACASPMKRYGPGSGYNYSPEIDACIAAGGTDCHAASAAIASVALAVAVALAVLESLRALIVRRRT